MKRLLRLTKKEQKMAIIRKNELKAMSNEQLKEKLIVMRNELMKLRSQVATRTRPENPGRIRELRRTIAKIHTLTKINLVKTQLGEIKNKKEVQKKKQ